MLNKTNNEANSLWGFDLRLSESLFCCASVQVMFLKGELQNLEAIVVDIRDDGKVLVLPKIDGFEEPIDCDPEELKKFFQV